MRRVHEVHTETRVTHPVSSEFSMVVAPSCSITVSYSDDRMNVPATHSLPDGSNTDALQLAVPSLDGAGRVGLGLTP